MFLLCFCLLAFAICFTYVEDWLVKTNRPAYLCWGAQYLALVSFGVDIWIFTATLAKLAIRAYRDFRNEISKK